MATKVDTAASPAKQSLAQKTTTLTNWKRLTNTTIEFDVKNALALVWREYIVVIDGSSPETLHFYHLKHGLWSKVSANVPSCDGERSIITLMGGCTFATHRDNLIILSNTGHVYKFSGNKWIVCPELTVLLCDNLDAYNRRSIFTSSPIGDDALDSLILLESQDILSLHTFRYFQTSRWSQPKKLQKSIYVFYPQPSRYQGYRGSYHSSFVVMKGSIYVSNGKEVCSISLLKPGADIIPVVEITKLEVLQYTISAVDGTLFAFGGKDEENQPSSDVYRYNSSSEIWEPAGYMRNARYGAIVTPVTQNKDVSILVIGGYLGRVNDVWLCSRVMESCEVHTS